MEKITLITKTGKFLCDSEKLDAHKKGLLHLAFSIFILKIKNKKLETLLQKRNPNKYHSGGLWSNTCCGHPRPGEDLIKAGKRRLHEELGISANLKDIGNFIYKFEFKNQLIENELDHVLLGRFEENQEIKINPKEVSEVKWLEINKLQKSLKENPKIYTPWLPKALNILSLKL